MLCTLTCPITFIDIVIYKCVFPVPCMSVKEPYPQESYVSEEEEREVLSDRTGVLKKKSIECKGYIPSSSV